MRKKLNDGYSIYKIIPVLLSFIFYFSTTKAQNKYTISGIVRDASTGETLIGASVLLQSGSPGAAISNTYGFYSLTGPGGDYSLTVSFVGYQTVTRPVALNQNLQLNIELSPNIELNEVVITSRAANDQVTNPQMGLEKLDISTIENVPVLFGERDIFKTIQLLPGIKSAGEGNAGFYVRGGSSDQNLVLLDEANVYNASHLLGFFSTFNSDAIKDVSVYKGGMPAQYGGRLASVVDIKMNEGNQKEYTAEGGIGLIASRLKVEGPISDRGAFMVSGRRTYADLFLKFSSDSTLKKSQLFFYDFNAKANYRLSDRSTIFLSGYFGQDVLSLNETFGIDWGNTTATMRLNHIFNSKLFSNTTLIYSDYNYAIENLDDRSGFRVTSVIKDWNLKQDFQYFASNGHTLRFGLNSILHEIRPGNISSSEISSISTKNIEKRHGLEAAAYISDEWTAGSRLSLVYGLRLSLFSLLGPGNFNTYNADGSVNTTTKVEKGKVAETYILLEPRVSASYKFGENTSLKASYTRNSQNLHLLSNSAAALPTDLWIMSSNVVKPQIADQVALGLYRNFSNNTYEFSAEVYYKDMQNQIDYKNAAQLTGNENVESELLFGDGRAYGVELFLKKRFGAFNGWIGYTLSRSERSFEGISNGDYFPARQDRTHDLSLVSIYNLSKRWTFSGTFVYNTGNAATFPSGKYEIDGKTVFYYSERNGYRMPDYHRLDLSATLNGKPGKRYQSSWSFGLYNAYNRHNAYTVEFRDNPDDRSKTQVVQTALFGIIPSVTWNFKF